MKCSLSLKVFHPHLLVVEHFRSLWVSKRDRSRKILLGFPMCALEAKAISLECIEPIAQIFFDFAISIKFVFFFSNYLLYNVVSIFSVA